MPKIFVLDLGESKPYVLVAHYKARGKMIRISRISRAKRVADLPLDELGRPIVL